MTLVPLGQIIASAKTRRAGSQKLPILSMTMHAGLVDQSSKFKKRVASEDTSTYKVVDRGQLVVGFPIDEGVLDFQSRYDEAVVSPAYGIWDVQDEGRVDRDYLSRYLRSPGALAFYRSKLRATTARRRSLPAELFLDLPVHLPSLEEQRRISALLSQADKIVALRTRSLSGFTALTGALFTSRFGDPVKNSRQLPERVLADWVTADAPITYGILKPGPDTPGGVPYVRVADIKSGKINVNTIRHTTPEIAQAYGRSRIATGDLVISIRGHVGRLGVVPASLDGANITQDSARLRIPTLAREYVAAALSSHAMGRWMDRRTKGAAVKGINLGDLRLAPIPVPSDEEMADFAAAAARINELIASASEELRVAKSLRSSLQTRAFSGRL
ncbi:hypothetical protein [Geodermatophilus sp. URMC 60]